MELCPHCGWYFTRPEGHDLFCRLHPYQLGEAQRERDAVQERIAAALERLADARKDTD